MFLLFSKTSSSSKSLSSMSGFLSFFLPFYHHTRKQHVCEVQRAAFPFIASTAILCKDVVTVTTPGDCVDVLVTDYGIAVNPLRPDIQKCLDIAGIPTVSIQSLAASPRFFPKKDGQNLSEYVIIPVEYWPSGGAPCTARNFLPLRPLLEVQLWSKKPFPQRILP